VNRLGHTLIAHRVFETVATNCSGVAATLKSTPKEAELELKRRNEAAIERIRYRYKEMGKVWCGTD
jgi:hypothetical protein